MFTMSSSQNTMPLLEVTVCVVLLLATTGNADITIIPQHFTVHFDSQGHPVNNLTVLCAPPADPTIKGITFLQLRKYRQGENSHTTLVTLTPFGADSFRLTPETGLAGRRHDLSGEIDAEEPLRSFLRMELYDSSCRDDGMFECSVHLYRKDAVESDILYHSANISTKTLPEQVLLSPRPFQDSYIVNQTVELHCSGQVGSPPFYFRWRYRHMTPEGEEETDYKDLTFGVTNSEGPYPQGFCKQFRRATLWLRAEMELNGVEIRCVPVRGVQEFLNMSAGFILTVKEAGCIPECQNGGVCRGDTCHCPAHFSGTFCEQAVNVPCVKECDTTSVSSITDITWHWLSMLLLMAITFHL